MTLLLLLLAALMLGYSAGWIDQRRKRRPQSSEWWDGWRVGRDHGFQAGRLTRPERDEE